MAAAAAPSASGAARPALALNDSRMQFDAREVGLVWLDTAGTSTIEQVSQPSADANFQPGSSDHIDSLGEQGEL